MISRGTVARLQRRVMAHLASLPPVCCIVEIEDLEDRATFDARVAEAERKAAAVRASGRRAAIIVIDREVDP